jgi:hypothetical protein
MKLWQHEKTGRLCWTGRVLDPQRFKQVPLACEDELPPPMSEAEYRWWYRNSMIIAGVRVGPNVDPSCWCQ